MRFIFLLAVLVGGLVAGCNAKKVADDDSGPRMKPPPGVKIKQPGKPEMDSPPVPPPMPPKEKEAAK